MAQQEDKVQALALEIAARCWCDEETKHITMDTALAEAFAKRLILGCGGELEHLEALASRC